MQEAAQPFADFRQIIADPAIIRRVWRPSTRISIVPGAIGQIGDLGRTETVTGGIVKIKILQRIGSNRCLGGLDRAGCVGGYALEPIYLRETTFVKAPAPRVV